MSNRDPQSEQNAIAARTQSLAYADRLKNVTAKREYGRLREALILAFIGRCRYTSAPPVKRLLGDYRQGAERALKRMQSRSLLKSTRVTKDAIRRVYYLSASSRAFLREQGLPAVELDASKLRWSQVGHDTLSQMLVAANVAANPSVPFCLDHELRGLNLPKLPDAVVGRTMLEVQNAHQDELEIESALGRLMMMLNGAQHQYTRNAIVYVRPLSTLRGYVRALDKDKVRARRPGGKLEWIRLDPGRFRLRPMMPDGSDDTLGEAVGLSGEDLERMLAPA